MRLALGIETAKTVQRLLFVLDAAPNLTALTSAPPIRHRPIHDTNSQQYSVGMPGAGQILFRTSNEVANKNANEISCITILTIGESV